MTALHLFIDSAPIQRLGIALVHSLWQCAAIALLLVVFNLLVRKSASARYAAACTALLLMILAPVLTCLTTRIDSPSAATARATSTPIPAPIPNAAPAPAPAPTFVAQSNSQPKSKSIALTASPTPITPPVTNPVIAPTTPSIPDPDLFRPALPWVVMLWSLGVVSLAVWNLGGWLSVHQLKSLSTRPAGVAAERALSQLARKLGVLRPVVVLQSTLAKTPLVIGALRPVILLPASVLNDLSLAEIDSILAHELSHIRRHDYLINLFQSAIDTLLFYHPAAWWVSKRIRIERENCCDDLALTLTNDPATYATALAAVASVRVPNFAPASSGGNLASRLRRVLGMSDTHSHGLQWMSGAAVITVCTLAVLLWVLPATSAKADDPDTITIRGRVLDPAGQPLADATVSTLVFRAEKPFSQTHSAKDGSFEITFHKSDAKRGPWFEQWTETVVMASRPGFGPDWNRFDQTDASGTLVLKLRPDDVPVEGRIVTLEGKPVPNVRLSIYNVIPNIIELKSADIEGGDMSYLSHPTSILPGWALGLQLPTTDADGRFRIAGIGRERTISLDLAGPGVRRDNLQVVTRPMPTASRNLQSYIQVSRTQYGANFEYTATPARAVTGTIRDAKTHAPLPGVTVVNGRTRYVKYLDNVITDAQGHYRIDSVPKGNDVQLLIVPDDHQPYFMKDVPVPDAAGLEPLNIDIELTRGVWITGKFTNIANGEGVPDVRIYYLPHTDNRFAFAHPEFHHDRANFKIPGDETRYTSGPDGSYRIVALPGKAIVAGWATGPFRHGYGSDKITAPFRTPQGSEFETYRPRASTNHPNTMTQIDIPDGVEKTTVDLPLDPGINISITTVGPDGKFLTGVASLHDYPSRPYYIQSSSTFDALAFREDEKRMLWFWHIPTKTAKVILISPADIPTRKLTVKLEPLATLTGKLIGADGTPMANARVQIAMDSQPAGTDAEGRFSLTVPPGRNVNLDGIKGREEFDTDAHNIPIIPGQTKDLGQVHYKSYFEKADAKNDDTITVHGRVFDPQGKPAAGAKVTVAPAWPSYSDDSLKAVIASANSASDGRFEISFKKSDASTFSLGYGASGADLWKKAQVVASFDGFGMDWQQFDHVNAAGEVELRLTDDVPLKGRIVDLEGRPVAGVTVRPTGIASHILSSNAQLQNRPKDFRGLGFPVAASANERTILTDADGRFQITGLGKERLVTFDFKANNVSIPTIRVMTRDGPALTGAWGSGDRDAQFKFYGSMFELAAAPSRIVTGTVRDAQSHEPLGGVAVNVNYGFHKVKTVTDAQGRYQLGGLEREGDVELRFSIEDRPYIPAISKVPAASGIQPVTLDAELFKGVWITGRVTDMQSKAGVLMYVNYVPLAVNQYAAKIPLFRIGYAQPPCYAETKSDGSYRVIAAPGPGIVAVRGMGSTYMLGKGFDAIKSKDKNGRIATLLPGYINNAGYVAAKEIDAASNSSTENVDFALDPGATLHITCTDPGGKPLDKIKVQGGQPGTFDARNVEFNDGQFDAKGFNGAEKRMIIVEDDHRHLAKIAVVSQADAKDGKLTIALQPAAYVKGRLINPQHDAINAGTVRIDTYIPELKQANRSAIAMPRTESDGRFKIELPPDTRLAVMASPSPYGGDFMIVTDSLNLGSGETIDLGDIEVSPEKMLK